MNEQHTTDPMNLPDNLPTPEDDGGADHLIGIKMPSISLQATSGVRIDLSTIPGRVVVYAYPMTGVPGVELPRGWNDIPGARGCTPQALSFHNEKNVFAELGVTVFGISTQRADYQKELSDRLGLSFVILSDAEFELTEALRLPTMTVDGMRLMKRLTLILNDGVIEHVFYPVFPPNRSAADVIDWLRENPTLEAESSGVLIYTTAQCPYCKAAKAFLAKKGVAFTEIDVERHPDAAKIVLARSGWRTVPQVFVGQHHVGGFDDLQELDLEDRFDSLFASYIQRSSTGSAPR